MMSVAAVLAITAIGVSVVVGYFAAQALVFMLEVASKLTEELR